MKPAVLELLRGVMGAGMAAVAGMEADPAQSREVVGIAFLYAENFLERQLRSRRIVLDYLDRGFHHVGR